MTNNTMAAFEGVLKRELERLLVSIDTDMETEWGRHESIRRLAHFRGWHDQTASDPNLQKVRDDMRAYELWAQGQPAVVKDKSGKLWTIRDSRLATPAIIKQGEGIVSTDGEYYGVMQPDCNFVVYLSPSRDFDASRAAWSTRTHVSGQDNMQCVFEVTAAGEFQITRPDGKVHKLESTGGPVDFIALDDQGKLVYYGRLTQKHKSGDLSYLFALPATYRDSECSMGKC